MSHAELSLTSKKDNFLTLKTIVSPIFNSNRLHVVCYIAVILDGAIDVLSGGLNTYFVMREVSDRSSKIIMWCAC